MAERLSPPGLGPAQQAREKQPALSVTPPLRIPRNPLPPSFLELGICVIGHLTGGTGGGKCSPSDSCVLRAPETRCRGTAAQWASVCSERQPCREGEPDVRRSGLMRLETGS